MKKKDFATMALVVAVLVLASCRAAPKAPLSPSTQPIPKAVPAPETQPTPQLQPSPPLLPAEDYPLFSTFGWKTDFSKYSVPYSEIVSGGVGKDGISPIYQPKEEKLGDARVFWKVSPSPFSTLKG